MFHFEQTDPGRLRHVNLLDELQGMSDVSVIIS